MRLSLGIALATWTFGCAPASPSASPVGDGIAFIDVPGHPFQALPSRDGAWLFASLISQSATPHTVALFRRNDRALEFVRAIGLKEAPSGMALSHDDKLLIVAAGSRIAFIDVARFITGSSDALLGYLQERPPRAFGRIAVNITRDDQFLFASDERNRTITVVNLAKARASHYSSDAIVGQVPVGNAPIGLAFSANEQYMYTTSQSMPSHYGWPIECRPEGAGGDAAPNHTKGAIVIVDVDRAKTDPAHARIDAIPAGCNPVRLVLSPNGEVAYVSARGDNALLAFDTSKLHTDPSHAQIGKVPVGPAPVGITVLNSGARVVVTSSNRFASRQDVPQKLYVIDATKVHAGASAIIGTIPTGAFPREMRVSSDGRTLFVTNFNSRTVEVIDVGRVSIEPVAP